MNTKNVSVSDTAKTQPQVAPIPKDTNRAPRKRRATASNAGPSVVGRGLEVVGSVNSEGDVQIEGVLKGPVKSRLLLVSESGMVEGPVTAADALIGGTVEGDITAKSDILVSGTVVGNIEARTVCLTSGARVSGNITHEIISIENGAIIEGSFKRRQFDAPTTSDDGAPPNRGFSARQYDQQRIIEKFRPLLGDRPAVVRDPPRRPRSRPTPTPRGDRRGSSRGTVATFGVLVAAAVLVGGFLLWPDTKEPGNGAPGTTASATPPARSTDSTTGQTPSETTARDSAAERTAGADERAATERAAAERAATERAAADERAATERAAAERAATKRAAAERAATERAAATAGADNRPTQPETGAQIATADGEVNPKAEYRAGQEAARTGNHDAAILHYTRAIDSGKLKSGQLLRAHRNRASAYAGKGEYEKAIADYTSVIEINPFDSVAYNNRGYAYNKLSQRDEAIADSSKAIEINPKYAYAYSNRCWAYEKKGMIEEAIADCRKALDLKSDLAFARRTLSRIGVTQ